MRDLWTSQGPLGAWNYQNAINFIQERGGQRCVLKILFHFPFFPIFFCFSLSTLLLPPRCSFLLVALSSKSHFLPSRSFLIVAPPSCSLLLGAPSSSSLLPMFFFFQERHFIKFDESITDGQMDGRTDDRTNEQMERLADGRMDGRTDGEAEK